MPENESKPWLAVRFEFTLKGLPPGFTGLTRSTYSIGQDTPVTLTEALVGAAVTGADFYLNYLEQDTATALSALRATADELQTIVDTLRAVKIKLKEPTDG